MVDHQMQIFGTTQVQIDDVDVDDDDADDGDDDDGDDDNDDDDHDDNDDDDDDDDVLQTLRNASTLRQFLVYHAATVRWEQ